MSIEELIKKYKNLIKEQVYILQDNKIIEKYPLNKVYKEIVEDLKIVESNIKIENREERQHDR